MVHLEEKTEQKLKDILIDVKRTSRSKSLKKAFDRLTRGKI